jgi:hypothetical protein
MAFWALKVSETMKPDGAISLIELGERISRALEVSRARNTLQNLDGVRVQINRKLNDQHRIVGEALKQLKAAYQRELVTDISKFLNKPTDVEELMEYWVRAKESLSLDIAEKFTEDCLSWAQEVTVGIDKKWVELRETIRSELDGDVKFLQLLVDIPREMMNRVETKLAMSYMANNGSFGRINDEEWEQLRELREQLKNLRASKGNVPDEVLVLIETVKSSDLSLEEFMGDENLVGRRWFSDNKMNGRFRIVWR